jgi:endonuclease/exonuclease/phosphatase family metal-dependent hydrolase
MKKLVVIPLLIVVFGNSCFAQDLEPKGILNVLSWNIYMRPAAFFWNGQMDRAKHIGALLKDSEYDVILFQEAFGKASSRVLREALKGEFPYEIKPLGDGKFFNNGLWVLSRIPIENIQSIFFNDCAGFDCGASKGAVFFEVEKDGFTYQLLNTHLQAEEGKKYAQVRAKQFIQMHELLEAHAELGVPQLAAGDMNTSRNNEKDYQEMISLMHGVDGEVCMPEDTYCASLEPTTWGCQNNSLIADKYKGQSSLLDYALIRNPRPKAKPTPLWAERMLKTFTSQWSSKHKHLSDHYAISIRLTP